MQFKNWFLQVGLSLSVAMARALSSCSSQCSCSSLRLEARNWPSTSAALFRLVTARRSLSAASLIFSSRWISCRSSDRASSKRCWKAGSKMSPSAKPLREVLWWREKVSNEISVQSTTILKQTKNKQTKRWKNRKLTIVTDENEGENWEVKTPHLQYCIMTMHQKQSLSAMSAEIWST